MVPSKNVEETLDELMRFLDKDDIIIDGGNSWFADSVKRSYNLKQKGIHFLDCGTSGGIEGAIYGACMMIGGDEEIFKKTEHLFRDLSIENGYAYLGKSGAGHFSKAVHNAIEYGYMAALAEGMRVVKNSFFDIDLRRLLEVYNHGSIIQSRLIGFLSDGMGKEYFESVSGSVPKGETEDEMRELAKILKMPVLRQAIQLREGSRPNPSDEGKFMSTMRYEFGRHPVNKVA